MTKTDQVIVAQAKATLHRAIDEMELTLDDILLLTALTTAFWAAHPAAIFQQLQDDTSEALAILRQPDNGVEQ